MTRRIGDDKFALIGREEAVSDINSDALLPLSGKTINEEREVNLIALRTRLFTIFFNRGELVFICLLYTSPSPRDRG